MKRLLNFRYFFILALSMIGFSSMLTMLFIDKNLKLIFLYTLIVCLLLILVLCISLKNRSLFVLVSILILGIVLSLNMIIRQNKVDSYTSYNDRNVVVSARICSDYSFNNSQKLSFIVDNIKIIDENTSKVVSGKMYVYISAYNVDLTKIEKGRYVTFLANLEMFEMEKENISYLSRNFIGRANNNTGIITFTDNYNLSLKEKIRDFVYRKLSSNNLEYAGIAYAMIFGDSSFIEDDVQVIFREGGIAHLLAVSGLHISIISSILLFIMKKLKMSKHSRLVISLIFLSFYSYLCDFSISVVRASLMAVIQMIAINKGKPYDRLSTLSLIVCIFLVINPINMYNYSFILSIFAVFVIILFQNLVSKLFNKYFYSKFSNSLSLCVSVQLGLSIIQLYLFGYFPILSIFSNLINVPIAVFGFILTIFLLIISLILPFMSFSLKIFDIIISIVIKFSAWINKLGLILILKNVNIIVMVIFMFGLFLCSPFIFQNKKHKFVVAFLIIALCIIIQTLLLM